MAHSNMTEWIYIGVVVALLVYVGAEAWNIERIIDHAPEDAEIIKVTAQQWFWSFEHEDGTKEVGELKQGTCWNGYMLQWWLRFWFMLVQKLGILKGL